MVEKTENQQAQDDFIMNVAKGLTRKAQEHLDRASKKLEEGASEQALEHLNDAIEMIRPLGQLDMQFRLTPQEKWQYQTLEDKIMRSEMSDADWQRYKYLGNKATEAEK